MWKESVVSGILQYISIANTEMAKGNKAMRWAICYVAERIEDKWQKQSHSELAIKAEKLPFAFPEELSLCYRTAVKHKADAEGNNRRCREGGKTKNIKEMPSHEGHT